MHLKVFLTAIVTLIVSSFSLYAQNEGRYWYFGTNAGISFATGSPVALTNGALSTSEGCASISNSNTGALLFYTDGVSVWNRNHNVMPNGNNLLGNSTSTQSAVIVPDPGDTNRYYIFSPGAIYNGQIISEQLVYSIVDMRLNNGLGNIPNTSKNIVLRNMGVSEKITVSIDCAGTGYWVITHHHSNNTFYAYHLTAQGVNTTAVTSQAGTFNQQYDYMIGQLKSSPNGKKIAVAVYHHNIPGRGGLELCDFDIATGQVSSAVLLRNNERFYGASFSPNNSKLYGVSDYIHQYDVTLSTSQQIINSRVQIASLGLITSMQLGPDGKIYAPRGNSLAVINQPNSSGTSCNFQDNAVSLGGRSSQYSIPNFLDRPFLSGKKGLTCAPPEATFEGDTICEGEYVEFIEDSDNYPTSWQWTFQGGSPSSYTGQTPPNIYYYNSGTYTATLVISNAFGSTTVNRTVKVITGPNAIVRNDTILCGGGTINLGGHAVSGVTYAWSPATNLDNPASSNPIATLNSTGTYRYTLIASISSGCITYDTVDITVSTYPVASAGLDTSLCIGGSSQIGMTSVTGVAYSWSPAAGLSNASISDPIATPTQTTQYILSATNTSNCVSYDTVVVTINPLPVASAGNDTQVCYGTSAQIGMNGVSNVNYSWAPMTGLSNASISNPVATPLQTTQYILTAINQFGCQSQDTIVVTVIDLPIAVAGADTSICIGSNTSIGQVAESGITYSWSPVTGLTASTSSQTMATPLQTTEYILTATNASGCVSTDTVIVTINPLPTASAGNDTLVCIGGSKQIGMTSVSNVTYSWSPTTGLSSSTISNPIATPTQTTQYILTATNQFGCQMQDSVLITVAPLPTANAGGDTVLCTGESKQIGMQAESNVIYSWSPSAGLTSTSISNPTATPSQTTQYILTVTNQLGCQSQDTVIITINSLPAASAGNDTLLCIGGSKQIGVTSISNVTYNWLPSNGLSNASISNPTATPTQTTQYILTATNQFGCQAQDTVLITVAPLPIASAGQDALVCLGISTQIGMTSVANVAYSWTPTTGLSSSTISDPIATPTQTTQYVLSAISQFGCETQDTVIITVSTYPVASAGLDTSLCIGGSSQIGMTSVTGVAYSWSPAAGLSNASISDPIATPTQTTQYILSATNTSNCVSYDTVVVTINPLPVASAGNDTQVCYGTSAQIGMNGVSNVNYSWAPMTGLSNASISNPVATPLQTTQYILTAINQFGCQSQDTIVVTVIDLPIAVAGADTSICIGSNTSIGQVAESGITYSWSPVTGLTASTSSQTMATPLQTTEYILTATNASGCVSTDTVIVTINPLPTASAGNDTLVCIGGSKQIGMTSVSNVTYSWSPTTGLSSSTISNPIATPTQTTQYILTATNQFGCQMQDSVLITVAPLPTANAGGDVIICQDNTVIIGAPAQIGLRYSWFPEEGLSNAFAASPIASPKQTTQYILTVFNEQNCVSVDTSLVEVVPFPALFQPKTIDLCLGENTLIGIDPEAGMQYSWFPTSGLSNPFIANPIVTAIANVTYTLTARNPRGGCESEATVTLKVSSTNAIVSRDTGICLGSNVQLVAQGGTKYLWSPAAGLDNPNIPTPIASPLQTTSYQVIVSGALCSDTAYVTVSVDTVQTADAGADITLCGDAVGTIGSPGKPGIAYRWLPAIGLSDPMSPTPIVYADKLPADNIQYTLTTWLIDYPACTTTDIVSVRVGEVDIEVSPNMNICKGDAVQLLASGGTRYLWTPSEGLSSDTVDSPIASPLKTTTYTVYAFSGRCKDSTTVTVNVSVPPTANAGSDAKMCTGDVVSIGSNAVAGYSYRWSPEAGLDNPFSSATNAYPSQTTEYILLVNEGTNNCIALDTVTVFVAAPVTSSASADKTTLCKGASTTLHANGNSANGILTYEWFPKTGLNSYDVADPVITQLDQTTMYSVRVTKEENGWFCIAEDSVLITLAPEPNITITSNSAICSNEGIVLKATGGVAYKWLPETGLSSSTIAEPLANPKESITYTVEITDENSCVYYREVRVDVMQSQHIDFSVSALETQAKPGGQLNVVLKGASQLPDISSLKAKLHFDPSVMQWVKGAIAVNDTTSDWVFSADDSEAGVLRISGSGKNPIPLASVTSTFDVFLTNVEDQLLTLEIDEINGYPFKEFFSRCSEATISNAAVDIAEICGGDMRLVKLSTEEYHLSQNAPNPVGASAEIAYSVALPSETTIILYNALGEEVKTIVSGFHQPGKYVAQFLSENLSNGVYFYRITSGPFTASKQMMIQK